VIVERIARDVIAAVVGAQEVAEGVGLVGGGTVVGCGTTLCMASAIPIAAGGALALQGVDTGVNAAIGIAQKAAILGGNNPSSGNNSSSTSEPHYLRGKPYANADLNGAVSIRQDIENVTSGEFPDFIRS
jgi:hypothetical protein